MKKRGRPPKYPTGSATVSFTCPVGLADSIAREANRTGKSQSDIVCEYLELGANRSIVAALWAHQLQEVDALCGQMREILNGTIYTYTATVDGHGPITGWICGDESRAREWYPNGRVVGSYRDEPHGDERLRGKPEKEMVGSLRRRGSTSRRIQRLLASHTPESSIH